MIQPKPPFWRRRLFKEVPSWFILIINPPASSGSSDRKIKGEKNEISNVFKTWKIETKYFCSPVRRGWSVRQMPANADLKCCIFWKKSISQVFLNVALSERKVFRALAIGRDWIRENIFVPMQTFMTAEAKTFAGNLFRTSNCGGMEPRMAGCRMWTLSLHAREALQGWIFTCLTCFLLHAQQLQ